MFIPNTAHVCSFLFLLGIPAALYSVQRVNNIWIIYYDAKYSIHIAEKSVITFFCIFILKIVKNLIGSGSKIFYGF